MVDRKERSKARKATREARKDPESKYYRRRSDDHSRRPTREQLKVYRENQKMFKDKSRNRLAGYTTAQELIQQAQQKVDVMREEKNIVESYRLPAEMREMARERKIQAQTEAVQFLEEAETFFTPRPPGHIGVVRKAYSVYGFAASKRVNKAINEPREKHEMMREMRSEIMDEHQQLKRDMESI